MFRAIIALGVQPLDSARREAFLGLAPQVHQKLQSAHSVDGSAVIQTDCDSRDSAAFARTMLVKNEHLIAGTVVLHNREVLQRQLEHDLASPHAITDLELILLAYRKWGDRCVDYLLGLYSFAIWNRKAMTFFAAVDQLGEHSLYYKIKDQKFIVFSDTLESLAGRSTTKIDQEYVLTYLLNCFQHPARTICSDISMLPPGSLMKVVNGELTISRYWNPEIGKDKKSVINGVDSAYQLKKLLFKAVACRIQEPGSIGIMLSGGLDSSSLACIAHKMLAEDSRELLAFSRVMPAALVSKFDGEEHFIQAVVKHLGIKVQYIEEMTITTSGQLQQYFENSHCFPFNPFPFLTEPLAESAATSGCRYVLNGLGGDETVSTFGLTSLALLVKAGNWIDLYKNLQLFREVNSVSWYNTIRGKILAPLLPEWSKQIYRFARGRTKIDFLGNKFVYPHVIRGTEAQQSLHSRSGYMDGKYLDPREELLDMVTGTYFRPLFQYYESSGARLGIKYMNPFLDKRVVEFMLAVHPREYLKDGWVRSLIRRSLGDILPEEIRQRKCKTPFNVGMPVSECLIASEDLILSTLSKKESAIWEIIDRTMLLDQYKLVKKEVAAGNSEKAGLPVYDIGRCIMVAAYYQWKGL